MYNFADSRVSFLGDLSVLSPLISSLNDVAKQLTLTLLFQPRRCCAFNAIPRCSRKEQKQTQIKTI